MTSTLIKRIALPVAMLVVVGAALVASTGAFFSDTETSTGNTFTAGAIDLKIDNTQHYDGMVCADNTEDQQVNYVWVEESQGSSTYPELLGQPCQGSWTLKDLVGEKFFNFTDVKPGDNGENTISIHIENNEAWACAAISNVTQADNSQTEPESLVDTPDGLTSGELGDVLHFFAWRETDGDNVYETGETALTPSPVPGDDVENGVWPIADSTTGTGPILPADTAYIGVSWCVGTMNPVASTDGENAITCDGTAVDNASQTDSMSADVTFTVVQSRNNLDYRCVPVQEPQGPTIADGGTTFAFSGGFRFRELLDSGGEQEHYLGKSDLGDGANRVAQHVDWASTPGSAPFTFAYVSGDDKFTSDVEAVSPTPTLEYSSVTSNVCAPADMDQVQVLVRTTADATVDVSNFTVDGVNFGTLVGTTAGALWTVSGIDATDGLTITGSVDTTGTLSGSNEGQKVEVLVGCSA